MNRFKRQLITLLKLKIPKIELPKGGGSIKGMGETFQPNLFTGSSGFQVPLPFSAARGFEPKVSLSYQSGAGNGVFGMGFQLSVPTISIRTEKGLPLYDGNDRYVLSGAEELVPVLLRKPDGSFEPEERILDQGKRIIRRYLPRTEGLFAAIERITDQREGRQTVYWRTISKDNVTSIYGYDSLERIADPDHPERIFQWLLTESWDALGNSVRYRYKAENTSGLDGELNEQNRSHSAQRYLKRVLYGNATPRPENQFYEPAENLLHMQPGYLFETVFDFGDQKKKLRKSYQEKSDWPVRPDSFSSYRSGFEVRTHRLCQRVLHFHHFDAIKKRHTKNPFPQKLISFDYAADNPHTSVSFVQQIQAFGCRFMKKNGHYGIYKKATPPLQLAWSTFPGTYDASIGFKALKVQNAVPNVLNRSNFQMLDLYGEGISGIVYSDEQSLLYWEPAYDPDQKAGVMFVGPKTVFEFPKEGRLDQRQNYSLTDVGGDGKPDLLVNQPGRMGYYPTEQNKWQHFRAFEQQPVVDMQARNLEQVDITGDGFGDLLLTEHDTLTWFKSLGKKGYDKPVKQILETELPLSFSAGEKELIRFGDLCGDGQQHKIRITANQVCFYPNLGYGRFGKPVYFDSAPDFGPEFQPKRLILADLDGSGTADLLYLDQHEIRVWYNDSGKRFSQPVSIPTPFQLDDLDMVNVADVLGNGTSSIIISGHEAHEQRVKHLYYDLSQGRKPHLLRQVNNNLGAVTNMRYRSSVHFYLKDKYEGKPWLTKLHFPVQVIEKNESIDYVSKSKLIQTYAYHHGYYDGEERQFNGFGRVEQFDTALYEQFYNLKDPASDPAFAQADEGLHLPPVKTVSWHHTGSLSDRQRISKAFEDEYFTDPVANKLPDTEIELKAGESLSDWSTLELMEASRALRGSVLRQEVYALDGSAKEKIPYTVTEANFTVKKIQDKATNHYPVMLVHPNTSQSYYYERELDDPRLEQQFTLEVNEFGQVLQSAKVVYPRRNTWQLTDWDKQERQRNGNQQETDAELKARLQSERQQDQRHIIVQRQQYINRIAENCRMIGIDQQSESFQILGKITPDAPDGSYTLPFLKAKIREALQQIVDFTVREVAENELKARRMGMARHFYWNEGRTDVATEAQIKSRLLLHHREELVFSEEQAKLLYLPLFEGQAEKLFHCLTNEGKYQYVEGAFWRRSAIQHYQQAGNFYLPFRQVDPWEVSTTQFFDQWNLLPVLMVQEAPGHYPFRTEVLLNDYQALQATSLKDANENINEVFLDEVGMVVTTAHYGEEWIPGEKPELAEYRGDRTLAEYQFLTPENSQQLLDHPELFVQGAGHYFYYDLFSWMREGKPAHSIEVLRETSENHGIPLHTGCNYQFKLSFSDGFGRDIQSKIRVEAGEAFLHDEKGMLKRDAQNKPIYDQTTERWQVSGRKVYNNKGKEVKQYEPFYSDIPDYESEAETNSYGHTPVMIYDPLQRVIETRLPDGFVTRAEHHAWHNVTHDPNDTLTLASDWYPGMALTEFGSHLTADIQQALDDALNKGKTLSYKPALTHFNSLYQAVQQVQVMQPEANFVTMNHHDVNGNLLHITDPRQYRKNAGRTQKVRNFSFHYDLLPPEKDEQGKEKEKARLKTESIDAGEQLMLFDAAGKPIRQKDSRQFVTRGEYDGLHRPKKIWVSGPFEDGVGTRLVQEVVYGDAGITTPVREILIKNLMGVAVLTRDQAGETSLIFNDIEGKTRITKQRLRVEYKTEANWLTEEIKPEAPAYHQEVWYDALKRPVYQLSYFDGAAQAFEYHQSGKLKSTRIIEHPEQIKDLFYKREDYLGRSWKSIVDNITYTAKNQREAIWYGNGTRTSYAYYSRTNRLKKLYTTAGNEVHQDIWYFYDPAGNITRILDDSQATVYNANAQVKPQSDYTYDAANRLIEARGRMHPACALPGDEPAFNPETWHKRTGKNDGLKLENYRQKYQYDEAGNLIRIRHIAAQSNKCWTRNLLVSELSNRAVLQNMSFQADGENSPVNYLQNPNPDETALQNCFDQRGNLRRLHLNGSVAAADNIFWNYRNNISKVILIDREKDPDDAEYYVYDSSGNRVRKVLERYTGAGIEREEKIYLGNLEIKRKYTVSGSISEERHTSHVSDDKRHVATRYTWREGKPAEVSENPHLRYRYDNHLGSCSLELDSSGKLIAYEEYLPYGGTALNAAENEVQVKLKEYRYSGKERDDSTGLYYYGARYYVPWLGRWMNPDPIGEKDGVNPWVFVHGNPINKVDPNGLDAVGLKGRPYAVKNPFTLNGSPANSNFEKPPSIPQLARLLGLSGTALGASFVVAGAALGVLYAGKVVMDARVEMKKSPVKRLREALDPTYNPHTEYSEEEFRSRFDVHYVALTYLRTHKIHDQVYAGRTSTFVIWPKGKHISDQRLLDIALARRDRKHEWGKKFGFSEVTTDKKGIVRNVNENMSNVEEARELHFAIKGREQYIIDFFGGALSDFGYSYDHVTDTANKGIWNIYQKETYSANKIPGTSKNNDYYYIYLGKSVLKFGHVPPKGYFLLKK